MQGYGETIFSINLQLWSTHSCLVEEKYNVRNTRQVALTEMIVHDLIIDLGLPLSIVEHSAFLRAMKTVDSRLTVLSRRTLCRETLPSALQKVMGRVKNACNDARFVALTLDVWSDRRVRSFIAITMHTVTEANGSLQNYLLVFHPLFGKRMWNEITSTLNSPQDNTPVRICADSSKTTQTSAKYTANNPMLKIKRSDCASLAFHIRFNFQLAMG